MYVILADMREDCGEDGAERRGITALGRVATARQDIIATVHTYLVDVRGLVKKDSSFDDRESYKQLEGPADAIVQLRNEAGAEVWF